MYNVNGKNVWLRIGVNDQDERKVNAYSECELDCLVWEYASYALPPDFPNPVGIWMTNKGERLHPMTWDEVIDQMLAMLKCLCFGKCKKGK